MICLDKTRKCNSKKVSLMHTFKASGMSSSDCTKYKSLSDFGVYKTAKCPKKTKHRSLNY